MNAGRWTVLIGLFIIIVLGAVALVVLPPKARAPATTGKEDLIRLFSPVAGEEITSPLSISGEARGYWFFEADFPVILTDWDGRIIAQGIAHAKGDWMTENFVPFEATLIFETPTPGDPALNRGSLILKKDNPSGLPSQDDALEIPVVFK